MVRHPGNAHVGVRDEAEHGHEIEREESQPEEKRPSPPRPPGPEPRRRGAPSQPGQPLERRGRIHRPARIDGTESGRPEAFRQVEGERQAGAGRARNDPPGQHELGRLGAVMLEPDRDHAEDEREREKGRARREIPAFDPPPLPPGVEQDHHGEHHHGALGKQGEQEPGEAPQVAAPFPRRVVVQVGRHRQEQQGQGERVLELGGPGHGFDRQGVHDEEQASQPGRFEAQPAQQAPEEERGEDMQGYAHGVITLRIISPEAPLQPLHRRLQGEIVGAGGAAPDLGQPGRVRQHRILRHLLVVVPQPAPAQDGRIDTGPGQDDHCRLSPRGRHHPLVGWAPHGGEAWAWAMSWRAWALSGQSS